MSRPFALRASLAAAVLVSSCLAGIVTASSAEAATYAWFKSPSGNIGCIMDATEVRCDIGVKTYKAPAKPASCPGDWGNSLGVGKKGKGFFRCVSDTTLGATSVLKYGKSKTFGRYKCTSRTTGMTCVNLKTLHGFTLAKSSYKRF